MAAKSSECDLCGDERGPCPQLDMKRGYQPLWGRFSTKAQGDHLLDSFPCLYGPGLFEPGSIQVFRTYVQFHPQLGGCAHAVILPVCLRRARAKSDARGEARPDAARLTLQHKRGRNS